MNLPLTIDKYYSTELSRIQVIEELNSLAKKVSFGGLRTDGFIVEVSENNFIIRRETSGLDFFTLEQYPPVEVFFISEQPGIISIRIRPNYINILFFGIFFLGVTAGAFLTREMTINGVTRVPGFSERLLFAGIGGVLPALWCYFAHIRPVKKAEQWIVRRLKLTVSDQGIG